MKRHLNHLRQQPEHVRLRAAIIMTAIGGSALTLLWLFILFPLQLKLTAPEPAATPVANQPPAPPEGEVGGIRSEASPTPPTELQFHGTRPTRRLEQTTPMPLSTPTPSPSPTPN